MKKHAVRITGLEKVVWAATGFGITITALLQMGIAGYFRTPFLYKISIRCRSVGKKSHKKRSSNFTYHYL